MTEEIKLDDGTKTTRSKQSSMITSIDRWLYICIISYLAAKCVVTNSQRIMVKGKETTIFKEAGMITSIDRWLYI